MHSETTEQAKSDKPPNNKVARLIESYNLGEAFGDRLEQLWTADGDERMSLRDLADLVNERLLEAAMSDSGMRPIEGEVKNIYHLLTDDGVSSGNRTEARQRLEHNGVDTDKLECDFITYQAIRSYLQEYRGATYEQETETARAQDVLQTVQRLQSRTQSVTAKNIDQLDSTDELSIGDHRVFVSVDVLCGDCNTQYELSELISSGGCECSPE
jgi:hypothetical protein